MLNLIDNSDGYWIIKTRGAISNPTNCWAQLGVGPLAELLWARLLFRQKHACFRFPNVFTCSVSFLAVFSSSSSSSARVCRSHRFSGDWSGEPPSMMKCDKDVMKPRWFLNWITTWDLHASREPGFYWNGEVSPLILLRSCFVLVPKCSGMITNQNPLVSFLISLFSANPNFVLLLLQAHRPSA